jgi:mRNA interferase RelE/StbE
LSYKVTWHEDVVGDLKRLDRTKAREIVEKVDEHLSKEPLALGKPLKGIFRGLHRYRCGDYRVIFTIERKEERLMVLTVGHRKDVYRMTTRLHPDPPG